MSCQTLIKKTSEKTYFGMNFSARMDDDELINSFTISSEKIDGNVSDLIIEDEIIDGQNVHFWISGGSNNTRYRIEVIATTSTTQIIEGEGILHVKG